MCGKPSSEQGPCTPGMHPIAPQARGGAFGGRNQRIRGAVAALGLDVTALPALIRPDKERSMIEVLMRRWLRSSLAALGLLTAAIPACAEERAFAYNVVHPSYGTIGSFTQSIAQNDGVTRIDSKLHVAVEVLGVVVHREEGDRTEIFHGDRLFSLRGVTVTNGTRIDIRGEVRGDRFVVTSPTGVAEAPADVAPSDPWMLKTLGVGTVISIKTGRLIPTRVTGGEPAMVSLQGVPVATRHFMARGDREQDIWLNDRDVPVMFRSVEDGTPIDFILRSPLRDAAIAEAHLAPAAKLQPDGGQLARSPLDP